MSEIYNPRDRSFIRKPEIKVCITCGQPITPDVKPMNNHMNIYINDISGNEVAFNSNEDFITIQGVDLRRKGVEKKSAEVAKEVTPTAPKPTTSPIKTFVPVKE